ncbi:MAG: SusC/RagA family TonB-linked outer membrane protein [Dysgonamonadaceae bacterium]|jgi:TonB-linked SusC/RagA family outer membrane protein|nr:SusC/RagA family TonB-linked outer membrane protein [Dysgonamonadaceae bacterium]
MRKKAVLFLCYLMFVQLLSAQQTAKSNIAKGMITDTSGEALIGASVRIKNTTLGTVADSDGHFEITIPASVANPVLVFSYVGYKEKSVLFKGEPELLVQLVENTILEDVVVTGIFNRAKESYTGAANKISQKDLELAGSHNLITSLRNIDPSFNLLENNLLGSDPNNIENMSITMRGATSLTDIQSDAQTAIRSNMPLFIIDMFEAPLKSVIDLDESRIESITLLKDASATALYGSKGSNGVIVITTKKPQAGKLRLTYKGKLSFEAPDLSSYNLMNAMEKLDYEYAANLYTPTNASYEDIENLLDIYNARRMDAVRGVDTYWLAYPVRLGVGQEHTLSVEGGENAMRYAINLGYNRIAGAMKGSNRNTINGNVYLSYAVNNFLFSNDIQITNNKAYNSPYGNFDDYAKMNAYFIPFDQYGQAIKKLDNVSYIGFSVNGGRTNTKNNMNPLWNASLPSLNESAYTRVVNNFMTEWHIIPQAFFIRGRFSVTTENNRSDVYISSENTLFDAYAEDSYNRKGRYDYKTGQEVDYEGDLTLNFSKTFNDKHQVFAGGGFNIYQKSLEWYSIRAEGLPIPDMDFLTTATQYEKEGKPAGSEELRRGLKSYLYANYTYNRRYFADFSTTMEGNSQFGANQRVAPFWSVGTGWNAHHESFLQDNYYLNIFRLRASYGVTGSVEFSPYQAMTMYGINNSNSYRGWFGMELKGIGNSDLQWQKTNALNIGADVEIFDSRLTAKIDVYHRITNDLLTSVNIPPAGGFGSYVANIGEVSNQGIESELKINIIRDRKNDFFWSVGGTIAHNKNKILKISNALEYFNEKIISEEGLTDAEKEAQRRNPSFLYKEGESINTIFVVRSKGIDPSTGKEIFVKLDGTETFTWNPADRIACGVSEPTIWGNFNTTVRYKGFTFTTFFNYKAGGYSYNNTLVDKVENIYPYENADRRVLYDRWKNPGDITFFKSVKEYGNTNATSRFVMKSNSVECSSLNLRYDFSEKWSKKHLLLSHLTLQATVQDVFYSSTIKRERGTLYPFSNKFYFSTTIQF